MTNLQVELDASRSHSQVVCSGLRIAVSFEQAPNEILKKVAGNVGNSSGGLALS
jgi:hypothetical protein